MKIARLANSRTATVLGAATIVVLAGSTGAVAAAHVHSSQIANNTILSRDIHNDTILSRDVHNDSIRGADIHAGGVHESDLAASVQNKLNAPALHLGDPNWSIIDRNVIGNGASYLRIGPSGAGDPVPAGVGSLGIRTGSGQDKAAFGDQASFAGTPLAAMTNPTYYQYVTGEDQAAYADNGVSLQMELWTTGQTGSGYSTLTFVPDQATPNKWTKVDASTAERWYLTGSAGQTTSCNQTTYCTLAEVNQKLPDATLLSVQFSKGRDYAFSGAVDKLSIGGKTYDFEPTGVMD